MPGDCLKLRELERLWLSTEKGHTAQVVFTLAPRPGQRVIGDGWRAVSRSLPVDSRDGGRFKSVFVRSHSCVKGAGCWF
ncbi:MAG: hypothetical protein CBARDCOR_5355 [uncultured Caballeronia sp.]|nr:MAG: hypothetical protein CBARDCOR_5355 [uncultured Caballeronia sp.]